MKLNYKNKKAFTLIELLIVIAIIGILFIVLVSRVDFATDKAKATGVQTDFRSFQVALETVSKENAGFASLGWNTGDDNGDRIRNSYDEGDIGTGVGTPGYHNGKVDSGEIWTGRKVYGETWTGTYTLVNPDDMTDTSAFEALEAAINANLDPKLHITIIPDLDNGGNPVGTAKIEMANSARDPWKKEYHGAYITNAQNDGADRGALVMYSNGANGTLGSEHSIAGGNVSIVIPGNNIAGKDDYAISVFYTYANGYGETVTITNGFSNNQTFVGSVSNVAAVNLEGSGQKYYSKAPADLTFRSNEPLDEFLEVRINGTVLSETHYTTSAGSTIVTLSAEYLASLRPGRYRMDVISLNNTTTGYFDIVEQNINNQHFYYDVPYMMGTLDDEGYLNLDQPIGIMMRNDGTIYCTAYNSPDYFPVWRYRYTIEGNVLTVHTDGDEELVPDGITATISEDGKNVYFDGIGNFAMSTAVAMSEGEYFYANCWFIMGPFVLDKDKESYEMPLTNYNGLDLTFGGTYRDCTNLKQMELPVGCKEIGTECFQNCTSLTSVTIPVTVKRIADSAFDNCTSLSTVIFNGTIEQWNAITKATIWHADIPATEVVCTNGVVTLK